MRALGLLAALVLAACSSPAPLAPEDAANVSTPVDPSGDTPEASDEPEPTDPAFLQIRPDSLSNAALQAFALAEAMQAGDTEGAGQSVAALLEDAGFDFPDDLTWSIQDVTNPVNFYRSATRTVFLSAIPDSSQTAAYWQNWSTLLTNGTWSPEAFFRDAVEARRLAAFNQAYLGAHELGHALAYRYAVNPRTDDGNVNCQELLADRVAAAALDRLAQADGRFDQLRGRYLALLASLQAAIPDASRRTMPERDTLIRGCRDTVVIDLNANDLTTLVPYASAFFARQLRLHQDEGPEPLAALADSVFFPALRAYFADAPEASGAIALDTPEDWYEMPRSQDGEDLRDLLDFLRNNAQTFAEAGLENAWDVLGDILRGAVSVDPSGTPWAVVITASTDSTDAMHRFSFTRLDTGATSSFDHGVQPDGLVYALESVAAVSDSVFVGLAQTAPWADSTPTTFRLFAHDLAGNYRWGPPLDGLPVGEPYRLLHDGNGALLLTLASGASAWPVDLDALTVGLRDDAPGRLPVVGLHPEVGFVLADATVLGHMTASGGTMAVGPGGTILYLGTETSTVRLAGTGFSSTRGGTDPDRVAFQEVLAAHPLGDADGTILVLERAAFEGEEGLIGARRLQVPALASE